MSESIKVLIEPLFLWPNKYKEQIILFFIPLQ